MISRLPRTWHRGFGEEGTIVWLTKSDPPSADVDPEQKWRERYISPTDLSKVQSAIKVFLAANKDKSTVILLKGET